MPRPRITIVPGTPAFNPAPVRTGFPIVDKEAIIRDGEPWQKYYQLVQGLFEFLVSRPALLSGLDAAKPDATRYPENSRYYATDGLIEYINLYGTPGDPTTATWTLM